MAFCTASKAYWFHNGRGFSHRTCLVQSATSIKALEFKCVQETVTCKLVSHLAACRRSYSCRVVFSGNMSVVQSQARMTSSPVDAKRSCEIIHEFKLQLFNSCPDFYTSGALVQQKWLQKQESLNLCISINANQAVMLC